MYQQAVYSVVRLPPLGYLDHLCLDTRSMVQQRQNQREASKGELKQDHLVRKVFFRTPPPLFASHMIDLVSAKSLASH